MRNQDWIALFNEQSAYNSQKRGIIKSPTIVSIWPVARSVEHPFGSIKQWMGEGGFLTRRLDNIRTVLSHNMRRAINLVGMPALITAAAR